MEKIRSFLLIVMLAVVTSAMAHDFSVTADGGTLFFTITDTTRNTVMVTYKGSIADGVTNEVTGDVEIPSKVKHGNAVYTVTAINAKTFSGATELTGIIIPSTVSSIGDFAFEGCTKLSKIILPGSQPKMGQGIFFKCTAIRDVSFGSDWKSIDLKAYRWSDSLKAITVPAKVEKLMNMKSLRSLESITVDVNNSRFSSVGGVLYDKSGKILYGVPRGYAGALKVQDGTETVTIGALIDCPNVTLIDIPASVKTFSFRETSRMTNLDEIIFRPEEPFVTAYIDGDGIFLLQVANKDVMITVPKEVKKDYASALTITAGEYYESTAEGQVPYYVGDGQLPSIKNINGVKNIETYEKD